MSRELGLVETQQALVANGLRVTRLSAVDGRSENADIIKRTSRGKFSSHRPDGGAGLQYWCIYLNNHNKATGVATQDDAAS